MKKQTKIGFMFMFLLAFALFVSAEVSAIELNPFANSKTFVPELKADMSDFLKEDFNSKYGAIQLSKTRFWIETDRIAEYSLTENTDQCLINCKSKGKAVLYTDGKLFDDKSFLNKKGIEVEIDSQYYIKEIETYYEDVPQYKEVCSLQEIISNSTIKDTNLLEKPITQEICNQELIGYEKVEKTKEVWNEYNFEVLKAGEYEWEMRGSKATSQSVDFIPTAHGKSLNEWSWWNSDWIYKKEILIQENSANTLNNYSVELFVEYNSNMNNNFSDLMFTNNTEDGELGYWIESKNDGVNATVWVKVPELTDSQNTSIFMYYGNALAESQSKIDNVFIFGDDFESSSLNDSKWEIKQGTGNWKTLSYNGKLWINGTGNMDDNNGASGAVRSIQTFNFKNSSKLLETRFFHNGRTGGTGTQYASIPFQVSEDSCGYTRDGIWINGCSDNIDYSIPWVLRFNGDMGYFEEQFQSTIISKSNGTYFNTIRKKTTGQVSSYTNTNVPSDNSPLKISLAGTSTYGSSPYSITTYDWVFVREYVSTEPTYTIGAEKILEGISITLNSPEDNLQSTSSTINFNATITPKEATIKNTTLYLNDEEYLDLYDTNETINYSKLLTLSDGNYTWNITACWIGVSTTENCTESDTRTFRIDATLPNITILSGNGTQPYYYSGINHAVNFTIEDDKLDSGWYSYNGTNKSITPLVSGDNNSITFSVEEGTYNLTIYANDSFGNVASKEVEWDYLIEETGKSFNSNSFTTKQETFYLNFTTPTEIIPVVYLEYNGTEYISTRTGTSTNHRISNVLIPNSTGNMSFRWKITWGTNTVYTPYYTQTVQSVSFLNFTSGNCAAGLTNVMNFIFKDESNQTALTNLNIKYNFEYGITGGTGAYSYGSLNAVTKLSLCINTSEAPTYEIGYGEIEYVQTGYTSRRYYLFDRTKLTNVTTNTTLYSLPNGDSTSFLVEIRSPTLQPYVDIYTSLLRWYPDLNEYKIVEMGNTDNKGQTVYKVKIEDVDYRIGIYNKNGSLIYLINPVRMVCLASPCSYTINVPVNTRDYLEETLEFEALIEYSDGVFTLTYNDPSQNTELIRFVVTQFSGIDDNTICETNGTSFTGLLTCNVSGYEGTLKAVAYRTASPENPIALKIVEIGETVFQGTFGLFLQFLISITLAFLGIINPMTAIILGLIAMVFGVMVIKTITYPILIAISVLGGIIIYMMRRNT